MDKSPSEFLEKLKTNAAGRYSASDLLKQLVEGFGGEAMLAQAIRAEFDNSPTGGLARTRVLSQVLEMYLNVQKMQPAVEVETLSDEELEDVIAAIWQKRMIPAKKPEDATEAIQAAADSPI